MNIYGLFVDTPVDPPVFLAFWRELPTPTEIKNILPRPLKDSELLYGHFVCTLAVIHRAVYHHETYYLRILEPGQLLYHAPSNVIH